MRRDGLVRALLVSALLASVACDSWHGDNLGAGDGKPIARPDATAPVVDAGPAHEDADVMEAEPVVDAGGDDAGGDAGRADAGPGLPTLGDDRVGHVACGGQGCQQGEVCCTGRADETDRVCKSGSCGLTEHSVGCDGAEDCQAGELCCLRDASGRRVGTCEAAERESSDAGTMAAQCAGGAQGEVEHVACHTDADCTSRPATPLCRTPGGLFSGYGACVSAHDDPETPGHDEQGLVDCGGTRCGLPGELCCASKSAAGVLGCGETAECGHSEYVVVCDGPEDCGSAEACCFVPTQAHADGGTSEVQTLCAPSCDMLGAEAVRRCHRDADCQAGQVCATEGDPASFGHCATPG